MAARIFAACLRKTLVSHLRSIGIRIDSFKMHTAFFHLSFSQNIVKSCIGGKKSHAHLDIFYVIFLFNLFNIGLWLPHNENGTQLCIRATCQFLICKRKTRPLLNLAGSKQSGLVGVTGVEHITELVKNKSNSENTVAHRNLFIFKQRAEVHINTGCPTHHSRGFIFFIVRNLASCNIIFFPQIFGFFKDFFN